VPAVRKVKKPALRRERARERLRQVTEVAGVTNGQKEKEKAGDAQERREEVPVIVADNASVSEREWYKSPASFTHYHTLTPPQRNMSLNTLRPLTTRTRAPIVRILVPNNHH
jgi:hypothetical protein